MAAKNHLWQVTAVLHTANWYCFYLFQKNYANYSQNIYAFTEMCDFLLRLNYLTVLIFKLPVYICN